ncbi:phosphohydrolase [Pseudomonas sp. SL4(2022)]|uniref:phosphohydrolase n=1 Tax=Pseudomonas sp. SL4(2022) TaxID=2994661 RepID=UPI00226E54C1|nr:phosphohydrolase [Pseudomonas sp. SL4(2022)]WAC45608.1 phosphohydrolase [Pseudomonas sp. SL4(2022)]
MSWILTHSGKPFDLHQPQAEQINMLDIAHALSMLCRFNGHCYRHYSVAQHSLLVADIVQSQGHGPEIQLQALLHDAPEAYVGDVTRPLKQLLWSTGGFFQYVEGGIWHAICEHFGLDPELPECIHTADMIALATEKRDLLPDHPTAWECLQGITPHRIELENWTPGQARQAFYDRLLELLATTHRARSAA